MASRRLTLVVLSLALVAPGGVAAQSPRPAGTPESASPGRLLVSAIADTLETGSFHVRVDVDGTLALDRPVMGHDTLELGGSVIEGDLTTAGTGRLTFKLAVQRRPDLHGEIVLPGEGDVWLRIEPIAGGVGADLLDQLPFVDDLVVDGEWRRIDGIVDPDALARLVPLLRSPLALPFLARVGVAVSREPDAACEAGSCAHLRVQVPPSAIPLGADVLTGEPVEADVLVGPDGHVLSVAVRVDVSAPVEAHGTYHLWLSGFGDPVPTPEAPS